MGEGRLVQGELQQWVLLIKNGNLFIILEPSHWKGGFSEEPSEVPLPAVSGSGGPEAS